MSDPIVHRGPLKSRRITEEQIIRIWFQESRNPLRRARCRLWAHRPSAIFPTVPVCRWCWKVRP